MLILWFSESYFLGILAGLKPFRKRTVIFQSVRSTWRCPWYNLCVLVNNASIASISFYFPWGLQIIHLIRPYLTASRLDIFCQDALQERDHEGKVYIRLLTIVCRDRQTVSNQFCFCNCTMHDVRSLALNPLSATIVVFNLFY